MKKIFLLLFSITAIASYFSKLQAQGSFEIQKEAFDKSNDVNMAMGIPNINFPLLNVPTLSSKLNIHVSLNYLVNNISSHNMISEVGSGWDILAGFSLNRVTHHITEDYTLKQGTNGMECQSNVFQYSIPGGSGKFMINYDKVKKNLVAKLFKLSKQKILIEKNTDTLAYKVKSFTVIDENGLKFIFDKTDISYYNGTAPGQRNILYHNNFNISKILDEKNNTLVTYEYDMTNKTIGSGTNSKQISRNKLTKINIANIGSINFNYSKSPTYPTDRDNYTLQNIALKDIAQNIIQQSVFEYDYNLQSLYTKGRNSSEIKKYTFEYNGSNFGSNKDPYGFTNLWFYCSMEEDHLYGPRSIYPALTSTGSLNKVHLPTGGTIEYTYESNTLPGGGDYKLEKILEIPYNTNTTTQYHFTLPPNIYQKLFFQNEMEIAAFGPTNPIPFTYDVKHIADNKWLILYDYSVVTSNGITQDCAAKYTNGAYGSLSQEYLLRTTGTNRQGIMKIYGLKSISDPFRYTKGLRIKNIKKYENDLGNPIENLIYDYSSFNDSSIPSSYTYSYSTSSGYIGDDVYDMAENIVYTNVKVYDSVKNYSTRYTFLDPNVIEQTFNLPYSIFEGTDYNSELKSGTPILVEQYDGSSHKVYSQEFTYDFETKIENNLANIISVPWLKNQGVIAKTYMDNNIILTDTSLMTYESEYGNLKSEKNTDANGEIIEKKYQYAFDLNNQKLLNANFVGVPLVQESLSTKNGFTKTLSKTELKFDNPVHNWVTSSVVYDVITGSPETVMTIDKYDDFGNPLQTTSKSGIPTTLVYGYHNSQIIAKIEGITYEALQNLNLLTPIINASNDDEADATKEIQLLSALDSFRKNQALKDYYITTYTYDPFIGVTSETSALGIRKKYVYDNLNNLIKTTDVNVITLQEYKNNIKQH